MMKSSPSHRAIKQHEAAVQRHGAAQLLRFPPQPGPSQQDPMMAGSGPPPSDAHDGNKRSVRVFYLSHLVRPDQLARLITDVPAICINGDSFIRLQSGEEIVSGVYDDAILLSRRERRQARKKLIASENTLVCWGGYPGGAPVVPYDKVACDS